ncbi:transcriptional regulator [Pseudidiomarina gelatinasegens]|uniref:Transcriptional regulator n=1 Tax=Pseudidiomarina gelatinasegens TaxID=2487740 RepID=A0A443Z4G1_9GAMM|nr:flavodoxin domain-containing protein [Pseudidiomarina gelatinasegens]RWU11550.1 transcriptional regulator [Pseudidiomarina gelatinasegens]|tara:strand:- start:979 stop:1566 length:588 start_codon:yes stop_codon:yes gene_type:complete
MTPKVLILYYSRNGATQQLADAIATGVQQAQGDALLRTVSGGGEPASNRDLSIEVDDLAQCDGLIMGSPVRFGHMASSLQQFWEQTSATWLKGQLQGKPAAVFTSGSSMHSGQESTLLAMGVPLLHHGMMLCGIPYTEPAIQQTTTGGSPYGASHVEHGQGIKLSTHEYQAAVALGKRVTHAARALITEREQGNL